MSEAIDEARKEEIKSAKTMTDFAYHSLREDIIQGRWSPATKLRIEHLRKEYDMGATPLREALSRLSSDGFVTTEGQRGFRVAPVSIDDLEDITELRIMLELKALSKSLLQGDDEWESRVVASFYQLTKVEMEKQASSAEWEKRNYDFHTTLISACSSRWLQRFYSILYDQHKRYRTLSIAALGKPAIPKRDLHQEHQRIYDAALARDVETACQETEQHIRRTAEISHLVLGEKVEV